MEEKKQQRQKLEPNVVLVARKPISAYILAAKKIKENHDCIIMKARGKNINVLVNLAEILKRDDKLKLKDLSINSETMMTDEGREVYVSGMVIILEK